MVNWMMQVFKLSERRACGLLDQPRSTQRRAMPTVDEDAALVAVMLTLVKELPRVGYRKLSVILKERGWVVNHKRVHRLWRTLGLGVSLVKPATKKRSKSQSTAANACHVRRAEYKNHVWTWDFIFDNTEDGVPLKWLSVSDEYTRECLAFEPRRTFDHRDVINVLASLMITRGKPSFIRSDNGPEFIAHALKDWLQTLGSDVAYIDPGSPWQNGYAESFHAQARREFLNAEVFIDVPDARVGGRRYRQFFNDIRPHGALGYQTPAAFAATLAHGAKHSGTGTAVNGMTLTH
jgi:transposase InsO family protein